jgi:apolipoprotein N-acyltransferase
VSNGTTAPIGRHRGIASVILLMIFTLGIYGIYWIFITFTELRAHRGEGVSGLVGFLLALIPVSIFLLPSYIGRMYSEDGQSPPVTGLTGLWALIPLVGSLVWVAKVQGALNRYWGAKTTAAEAPAASDAAPEAPPMSEGE